MHHNACPMSIELGQPFSYLSLTSMGNSQFQSKLKWSSILSHWQATARSGVLGSWKLLLVPLLLPIPTSHMATGQRLEFSNSQWKSCNHIFKICRILHATSFLLSPRKLNTWANSYQSANVIRMKFVTEGILVLFFFWSKILIYHIATFT